MVTYHASRYRIAGNFQGRKLAKFEVCESFPMKITFHQLAKVSHYTVSGTLVS